MPWQMVLTWEPGIEQCDKEVIHWAVSPVQVNLVLKVISTLVYLASLTAAKGWECSEEKALQKEDVFCKSPALGLSE